MTRVCLCCKGISFNLQSQPKIKGFCTDQRRRVLSECQTHFNDGQKAVCGTQNMVLINCTDSALSASLTRIAFDKNVSNSEMAKHTFDKICLSFAMVALCFNIFIIDSIPNRVHFLYFASLNK